MCDDTIFDADGVDADGDDDDDEDKDDDADVDDDTLDGITPRPHIDTDDGDADKQGI